MKHLIIDAGSSGVVAAASVIKGGLPSLPQKTR